MNRTQQLYRQTNNNITFKSLLQKHWNGHVVSRIPRTWSAFSSSIVKATDQFIQSKLTQTVYGTKNTNRISTAFPATFPNAIEKQKALNSLGYRVFLTTNEYNQSSTLEFLKTAPRTGNTFIGPSGFCLLNMAAIRLTNPSAQEGKDTIIIADISKNMEHFWKQASAIIKDAPSPESVLKSIEDLLNSNANSYYNNECGLFGSKTENEIVKEEIQALKEEIKNKESWLSDDARFKAIQKVFKNNRFVFTRADLCSTELKNELASFLLKEKLKVDLFYVSNISSMYADEAEAARLRNLIASLVPEGSLFIHADKPTREQTVIQRA